jgi:hypothetical protein
MTGATVLMLQAVIFGVARERESVCAAALQHVKVLERTQQWRAAVAASAAAACACALLQ